MKALKTNTKLEVSNKSLSACGGLYLVDQLAKAAGIEAVEPFLPKQKKRTKAGPLEKFNALLLGFVAGADCLDDMPRKGCDPLFTTLNGGHVNAANTYGEYLRAFTAVQCRQLNFELTNLSLRLRAASHKKKTDFILNVDSSIHVQSGEKMEGLHYDYKNQWGLDSIEAYDQFGYPYWLDVRKGGTFTANGSTEIIHQVFSRVSKKVRRYLRADSGYCNVDVFNACKDKNVGFVIAMRANMYEPLIKRVKNWKKAKTIFFRDGRECEIGHTVHYAVGGRETLRVTFIRALRPKEQNAALFDDARYDYHAFVANIGHHEMDNETLIHFYQDRGNCENFIREIKNGFDLKHFPCQKLIANKAYGLIGMFAYALMRYMGWLLDPAKPRFSKIVRFRMINLACQVVRHARGLILRFNSHQLEEVRRWLTTIKNQFGKSVSLTH